MVYTLNLQEASPKSIGDVALCLMVLKPLFLAIFVVGVAWWDFDFGLPVPSSDWSEWLCMASPIFTFVKSFLFLFLEEHLWKSWCSILLLVGVNHSRIVASLVASISPYCRQGKPPKHLKVKRQAVIINY